MRLCDSKLKANKLIKAVQRAFDRFLILNGRNMNPHSAINLRDHIPGRNKAKSQGVINHINNFFTTAVDKNAYLAKAIRHLKNLLAQSKRKHLLVREVIPALPICKPINQSLRATQRWLLPYPAPGPYPAFYPVQLAEWLP